MNCFGFSEDDPHTPPTSSTGLDADHPRLNPSAAPKPKLKRKNSLSIFLGLLVTPPPSPRTSPTSPSSTSNKRRSWPHGQRPTISNPRPRSFYPTKPDSDLSRAVRAAFEGLPSPVNTPDSDPLPGAGNSMEGNNRVSLLHPEMASTAKLKQIKEAQDMKMRVEERAKKSGVAVPPYEFLELIGKGSFGRVFRSRRAKDQEVVAVKVIDVDKSDYKLVAAEKDQAIKDFVTEISVLHTLKDSKAKNINIIYEAFNFHSQLWIVSEYCPGGSVHTLLKASPKGVLEEKYIIPIARELAIALKYVHEAGIVHRDVKAANVLITQDGQLQLCDFGVSGILESSSGKRSTIIGSPFWMAPELHGDPEMRTPYGTEIDCWAFGCTVYELATGLPPNSNIAPHRLHMFLSKAPRLEGGEYSAGLREFVAFCLEERPEDRPTADGILKHSFVANTSKKYPTPILRQLIERFTQWESAGGQRQSLHPQFGAAAPSAYDPFAAEAVDEWNFSTTDDFTEELLNRFAPRTPDISVEGDGDEETPRQKTLRAMTPYEKAQQEDRVARGGRKMARVFDETAQPYDFDDDPLSIASDLPLRRGSAARSADRETIIDLDAARISQDVSNLTNLDLAGVETIKANRGRLRFLDDDDEDEHYQNQLTKRLTRDWTFPGADDMTAPATDRPRTLDWSMAKATAEARYASQSADEDFSNPNAPSRHLAPPFRPTLKHTITEPVGNFGDFLHPVSALDIPTSDLSYEPPDRSSMIDLDEAGFSTLSRQHSFASSAGESAVASADPFYLDDELGNNENTIRAKRSHRTSFHMHSQSEPSAGDRTSAGYADHTRGSSLSSESELERQQRHDQGINSAPLSRSVSVENSIGSTEQDASEDDYWPRVLPGLHDGLGEIKRPLLNGRNLAKNWAKYDEEAASSADVSDVDNTHSTYNSASQLDDIDAQQRQLQMGSESSRSGDPVRPFRHGRGRSKIQDVRDRHGDPILDAAGEVTIDELPSHRQHRRVVSFPHPQAPDVLALEEDAELETVMNEMERLVDDYVLGLRAVGQLLGDRGVDAGPANGFGYDGGEAGEADTHDRGYESSRSVPMGGE